MEKILKSIDDTLKQLLEEVQNSNRRLGNIEGDVGYLSFIDSHLEEIKAKGKKKS